MASAIFSANELRNRSYVNTPQHKIYGQELDKWELYIELKDDKFQLQVSQSNGQFVIDVNGSEYKIEKSNINLSETLLNVRINDEPYTLQLVSKKPNGFYQIM